MPNAETGQGKSSSRLVDSPLVEDLKQIDRVGLGETFAVGHRQGACKDVQAADQAFGRSLLIFDFVDLLARMISREARIRKIMDQLHRNID